MTTPLTQMPRPEAAQFSAKRKLFLVPIFLFPPDMPDDASRLLERYWSEVRDHIQNLERTLGGVKYVFHETIYADGEEGDEDGRGDEPVRRHLHSGDVQRGRFS